MSSDFGRFATENQSWYRAVWTRVSVLEPEGSETVWINNDSCSRHQITKEEKERNQQPSPGKAGKEICGSSLTWRWGTYMPFFFFLNPYTSSSHHWHFWPIRISGIWQNPEQHFYFYTTEQLRVVQGPSNFSLMDLGFKLTNVQLVVQHLRHLANISPSF